MAVGCHVLTPSSLSGMMRAPTWRRASVGAPLNPGSESVLSSMVPTGWLVLGGLFAVGGLVLVQRRRVGGRP